MNSLGEHITAFMIALVLFIALYLCIATLETQPEELHPDTEPIVNEVVVMERTGTPPPELEIKEIINEKDLDLLSRLIQAEAGATWCRDELQLATGSVVLNRIKSDKYPDTMEGVIFQKDPIQYSTAEKLEKVVPTSRAIENARYLLTEGVTIPEDVIYQANFKQGKLYKEIQGVYFGR